MSKFKGKKILVILHNFYSHSRSEYQTFFQYWKNTIGQRRKLPCNPNNYLSQKIYWLPFTGDYLPCSILVTLLLHKCLLVSKRTIAAKLYTSTCTLSIYSGSYNWWFSLVWPKKVHLDYNWQFPHFHLQQTFSSGTKMYRNSNFELILHMKIWKNYPKSRHSIKIAEILDAALHSVRAM